MFEKIVETINNTGKVVGEKTKQGSEVVKANIKISSEERALNELYTEIGKTYYENNRENPCCDTMKELFEMADEKKAVISDLKQQLRAIKGVSVCGNCGAECPIENDFCGKCGAKIEKPEPPVETPEEEVIDHEDTVEINEEINIEVVDDAKTDDAE